MYLRYLRHFPSVLISSLNLLDVAYQILIKLSISVVIMYTMGCHEMLDDRRCAYTGMLSNCVKTLIN